MTCCRCPKDKYRARVPVISIPDVKIPVELPKADPDGYVEVTLPHQCPYRFGCVINSKRGILSEITTVNDCRCVQFELTKRDRFGPTHEISPIERYRLNEYCVRTDTRFYVHCPVVAMSNLSSTTNIRLSKNVVQKELDQIHNLPGACVLHVGKVGTIQQVAKVLNDLEFQPGRSHKLLLETAAGQGTELGKSWDELRHLFEALDTNKIGLCVDTQHLFASGMNPLQCHEHIVRLFDDIEEICPSGVTLIHLNDSKNDFGSRVDRHESLKEGKIWTRDDRGLRALVERCHEKQIDMILETPKQYQCLTFLKDTFIHRK